MSDTKSDGRERADPEEVDKGPVLSMSDCPNCGPNTLTTVKVENAVYIAGCSSCDHEVKAPVVVDEDGTHIVDFANEIDDGTDTSATVTNHDHRPH